MARIRTIKPEFWTDERILESSPMARLLLIGLLNFADDKGNIEAGGKSIKGRVFPCDDIKVAPLLLELCEKKLLIPYTVNGENYYNIRGFLKHQKIDNPSKPRCPLYDPSANPPPPLAESSSLEGKGREGKGIKNTLSDRLLVAPNSRENFELAWDAYPLKRDKEKAFTHFKAQIKTEQDFKNLGIAMVNYIQDVALERKNGFSDLRFKDGKTFFNKSWKGYIDYQPPPKKTADGIPAGRDLKKDELKARIWNEMEFVKGEVLEGKFNFGDLMASTWLWMAVGKSLVEFEQRFAEDPLDKERRQFYDDLVAEYKMQDDLIEGTG